MHPQPWHTAGQRHHVALNLTRLQQHYVCPRQPHRCPGNRPSAVDQCGLTAGRHGRPILLLEVRLPFPIHVSGQLLKLLFQDHCSVTSSRLGIQLCRWSEECGGGLFTTVRDPLVLLLTITGRPDLPQLPEATSDCLTTFGE